MNETQQTAVAGPVEPTVRPLVQRLREGAAPLDDPDLNDEAADRIEFLIWALTDVLKVATSWNLFSTTTIDRKPSSTTMRLRAAAAVLRGPNVLAERPQTAAPQPE